MSYKIFAVAGVLAGMICTGTNAQEGAGVEPFLACADIGAEQARLACFDAAVAEARGSVAEPIAQPPVAAAPPVEQSADAAPAPPPVAEERAIFDFGRAESETLAYDVAAFSDTADGRLRIELADGQVWTQSQARRVTIPRNEEIVAEITPGSFGSYFMRLNGGPRFRVRRDR